VPPSDEERDCEGVGEVMDTTPEYIKMCEKAEEIQATWKPRWGDWVGDKGEPENGGNVLMMVRFKDSGYTASQDKEDLIFLPRQDQLQEDLIFLPRQDQLQEMELNRLGCTVGHLLADFYIFCDTYIPKENTIPVGLLEDSFEKLWLRFFMFKRGKVWTGEEWAK
jgi:hypothetical protein